MTLALEVEQQRAENTIGASEAAAALGMDSHGSPIEIWRRLRGLPVDEPPEFVREAAEWGKALEPVVRGRYAIAKHATVWIPHESIVRDGWLRATPDGLVRIAEHITAVGSFEWTFGADYRTLQSPDPEGLRPTFEGLTQIKCRSAWQRDNWLNGVPLAEEIQCRVEMAVCDLPWNDCAVLIGGNQMLIHRIERDLAIEDRILTDLRAFWLLVRDGREPSPDASEAWRKHASERMRPTKTTLVADDETNEIVRDWLNARTARKKLEAVEEQAKTKLLLRMSAAAATVLKSQSGMIPAYKTGGRSDWKGYAKSLGGADKAPERFVKPSTTWTLKAPGDDE